MRHIGVTTDGQLVGPSVWRIDPLLGAAPDWLSIGANDGLLTGTPTGLGGAEVVGVTVVLENGGRQSAVRLALRVLPTTAGLEITTSSLPAVVNSSLTQYQFQLGAAGGVHPYTWRLAGGTLPTGMPLSSNGVLVGRDYLHDIAVENQDGPPLARPLTWRVTGAVPGGLLVTPQSELITVAGRPTQSGTFSFTISVEDNNGRSDSLEFTMTVHPARYRVLNTLAEVLRPDEVVSTALSVSPAGNVSYRVSSGSLPKGLSLDSAGLLSGTVASEGSEGLWAFVVEVTDASGMTGLTPLALRVERAARTQGCSSVSTGSSSWALLGLVALVFARRRRSPGPQ